MSNHVITATEEISVNDKPLMKATEADLPSIVELANQQHDLAGKAARTAIEHAVVAGRLLVRANIVVKHGEWLPWLKANFNGSARTAQKYMKLAQQFQLLPTKAKAPSTAHLTIDKALEALAKPSRKSVERAFRENRKPLAGAPQSDSAERGVFNVDDALQDVRYAVRNIVNRFPLEFKAEAADELREIANEIDREANGGGAR